MATFAFVGYGELGSCLAEGLADSGCHELRAYLRHTPPPGSPRSERLERAGTHRYERLEDALAGVDAVLSTVPVSAMEEVVDRCQSLLAPRTLYVDFASAAPERKSRAAHLVAAAGGLYVDAAVLGTVITSGPAVPILASGPGADAFRELVTPAGLNVRAIDAPAGQAALVKLIRGIYLKGRDALIVETLVTAKRYGVLEFVTTSIGGPGEQVPFPDLADRVLRSLAIHAGRRADELAATGEVIRQAGLEPGLAEAGVRTLRSLADLGLADGFGAERPEDASAVLEAFDAGLSARTG